MSGRVSLWQVLTGDVRGRGTLRTGPPGGIERVEHQIRERQLGIALTIDAALHHVLELPHVAGPGVIQQQLGRLARKSGKQGITQLPGHAVGEVLRQHQYVLAPLPQGGQSDDIKGKPVQQVVAKVPLVGQRRQVLVGGTHQPYIHLEGFGPTHPLEFTVFNDPQQFFLYPGAGGCQLVEEQSAAIGALEPALMALGCAGEGSCLVAEQLGFQQALAQGGAVDGDKALIPTPREIM